MKTFETVNGQTFLISTYKGSNKKLVSNYHKVTNYDGNGSFSWDMFGDPTTTLISEPCARVTDKAIKEQHAKALLMFDESVKVEQTAEPEKKPLQVGSHVFLNGYGKDKHNSNCFVYHIEGQNVFFIDVDTKELDNSTHVKHETQIFGIGVYYSDKMHNDLNELQNLVIEAKQAEADKEKAEAAEREEKNNLRLQAIEEGKKILTIPESAKAVIVAEYYVNESDSQTDYFNARVTKKIYLGFSDTTRNNEKELQRAALLLPETAEFATTKAEKSCLYYQPSYYVGSSTVGGWKVSKENYNKDYFVSTENLYIAAANGEFIKKEDYKTIEEIEPLKIRNVEIIDYSEKAIAVIGDTKEIKDYLKEFGGRFNFRLSCGPGWIFPKSKREQIEDFLSVEA